MAASTTEVLVIGAGFAGLQAAAALQARGLRVQVLEARDRLGGRSRPATLAGRRLDLGAQWVGLGHARLQALARRAGAALLPQYDQGDKLLQLGHRLRRYSGLIPPVSPLALIEMQGVIWRLRQLQKAVPAAAPWEAPHAADLDALTVEQWQRRWLHSAGGRALFDLALRAVFCGEAGQLSMLGFLHYLAGNGGFERLIAARDGAQAATVDGGLHALTATLAEGLEIEREAAVRALRREGEAWIAQGADGRDWRARRVVLAMAPLLSSRIEIPGLSAEREQLGQRMPMGSVIKCLVAYERPFWREQGLSGEFVCPQAVFSPVFDVSPPDGGHGALVGFIDGPLAWRWSGDAGARRRAVIESLVAAFGAQAAEPIDYQDHDWIGDPWSRGCYVGLPAPGTLSRLGPALRAPQAGLHFAGTETARAWVGYVEGALESGERVAEEVASSLSA
ncbi:MAG TPA: NAD(P)/FAD-dependent oxidoreductase [Nevskiaceae bacterium]|nr:NAD(P)/FAD-dependent oxidoreductase [Nevskiaceae bacterium]